MTKFEFKKAIANRVAIERKEMLLWDVVRFMYENLGDVRVNKVFDCIDELVEARVLMYWEDNKVTVFEDFEYYEDDPDETIEKYRARLATCKYFDVDYLTR